MSIRTLKTTVSISFLVCMAAICILCCFESLVGALLAGAVWVVFYLIISALYAKCPHCGKRLGKNYLQLEICPHCEHPLD